MLIPDYRNAVEADRSYKGDNQSAECDDTSDLEEHFSFEYVLFALCGSWALSIAIGVWLVGASLLKLILSVIIVTVSLLFILYFISRRKRDERSTAIVAQAEALGLSYMPIAPEPWLEVLKSIEAIPSWDHRQLRIRNFVSGIYHELPISVFDADTVYKDPDGYNFAARMAVMPTAASALPDFAIQPALFVNTAVKRFFSKNQIVLNGSDIQQRVSQHYEISCKNGETLIAALPEQFLVYLADCPGWMIEKQRNLLFIARLEPAVKKAVFLDNKKSFQLTGPILPPLKSHSFSPMGRADQLERFMHQSLQIRRLVFDSAQVPSASVIGDETPTWQRMLSDEETG